MSLSIAHEDLEALSPRLRLRTSPRERLLTHEDLIMPSVSLDKQCDEAVTWNKGLIAIVALSLCFTMMMMLNVFWQPTHTNSINKLIITDKLPENIEINLPSNHDYNIIKNCIHSNDIAIVFVGASAREDLLHELDAFNILVTFVSATCDDAKITREKLHEIGAAHEVFVDTDECDKDLWMQLDKEHEKIAIDVPAEFDAMREVITKRCRSENECSILRMNVKDFERGNIGWLRYYFANQHSFVTLSSCLED